MPSFSRFPDWYQQNRFLVLLGILIILLCVHPLSETQPGLSTLFGLVVACMLLLHILTLARNSAEKHLGILLAVPEMALIVLKFAFAHTPWELSFTAWGALMFIPFHTYAIMVIYRFLFNQVRVTLDEIRGAICVYMLLGATWSALFYAWELFFPGSWVFIHSNGAPLTWFDLLYFSFATLGSLGFGDITPVNTLARSFTMIESTTGLFFVAITVARLVTQFMHHEQTADTRDNAKDTTL